MKPPKNPIWIFLVGVLFLALAFVFLICTDTPMEQREETPIKTVERHEAIPYPEEDTMHYLTQEGELIIYDGTE